VDHHQATCINSRCSHNLLLLVFLFIGLTGDRYGKAFHKKLIEEYLTFDDPALGKKEKGIRDKRASEAVKKEASGGGGFWGRKRN